MNKFSWGKALGFALLIWAAMFGLTWLAIATGIFASVWTQVVLAILAGVLAYAFATNTQSRDVSHALGYGAVFAAVGIVLDLIISQQLVSGLFSLWTYYLTYAAILFAPAIQHGLSSEPSARAV